MLRIQRWTDGSRVGFALSGRVEASHVADLEALLAAEQPSSIVLDLAGVTLVASEVVPFLAQCEASGIELRECPTYIRVWITQHSR